MTESRKVVEKYRTYWIDSQGEFHREDGPAIEYQNGSKEWWVNGMRHRVGGPAVDCKYGVKEWFVNGKYHRVDGPAIEYPDGEMDWLINGMQFSSQEEWFEALSKEEQITYLFKME